MKILSYTITAILFLLGIFFYTRADAGSINSIDFNPEFLINASDEDYINPQSTIVKKCRQHGYWMTHYYNKSKQITWYLPNYDDRELGKMCFSTAVATAIPPNNIPKIIAVAIGLFTKYGLDCIDSFHEANHYIHRAGYHADMFSFYCDMIPEDNDEEPDPEW